MTHVIDGTQQPQNAPSDADSPAEIEAERDAQLALEEYFARLKAAKPNSSREAAASPRPAGGTSPYHDLDV